MVGPVVKPGLTDRIVRLSVAQPVVTVVVALLVLGGISVAALSGIATGETTAASLPESSTTNRVARVLDDEMTVNEIDAPFVVGPLVDFGAAPEQLAEYTSALSEIEGVARADSTEGSFTDGAEVTVPEAINERLANADANLVRAPLSVTADSPAAGSAVEGIDSVNAPFRGDVGGTTARNLATVAAVDSRAPDHGHHRPARRFRPRRMAAAGVADGRPARRRRRVCRPPGRCWRSGSGSSRGS